MFSRSMFGVSAFTIAVGASFWSSPRAISGESPPQNEGSACYLPIQSISYDFGSKSMRGYFVQQGSVCIVTLMVIEKSDPDRPSPLTASRVRLMMDPGQIAELDSEEGRSINFICGEDAAALIVDYGERSKPIAQQGVAVSNTVADRTHASATSWGDAVSEPTEQMEPMHSEALRLRNHAPRSAGRHSNVH